MVTVMDEFSRFILAHKLQRDMTFDSFIKVVQDAVDKTGMIEVPVAGRTRLLKDNGSGYVSQAFGDYLRPVGHQTHPGHAIPRLDQRQAGALSPDHQAGRQPVLYEVPPDLETAIATFVSFYNYRRYHKALGNVTLSDAPKGSRQEILQRRKEVQAQTIEKRRRYNSALSELTGPPSNT